ncbi:MAG: MFS transporter [Candidatus Eisenbacteria bacterium]|uniref:MFS transporter n=1 Tax=Eiseniibacteriota bacterium TaxID=2212470 RepID=A0A538THL6_UNCEI|nr:MAG: MFS transporter [Candidatus Eisenbacteria bacterium]
MSTQRIPSGAERFLRLFTDIRAGEAGTALLLTANVFLLICADSLLKVLREPLILAGGGAEVKAYSSAGQALLLLAAVPLYGMLASRFPRRRLINTVTTFFLVCLVAFFALARLHAPVGVVFYIWLGIFNVMVIAQFWSFANDLYTSDEGKRLFPIVAFGQSAGAVLGAYLAGRAIDWVGLYPIFLIAAVLLVLGTVITNVVDVRERRRTEASRSVTESTASSPASTREVRLESGEFRIADLKAEMGKAAPAPTPAEPRRPDPAPRKVEGAVGRANSFKLVFASRYLLLIALMIFILNWVNSTGEYILGRTVARAATEKVSAMFATPEAADAMKKVFIGKFYANYQLGVNVLGLVFQLFFVSRILKWFGVRAAVMVLPAIALLGYGCLTFFPILSVVRWVKTGENATDYSLQNTVRQVLFLPTTREQKYKAKQAIDSFFVRAGDVFSAGLVYVGSQLLALSPSGFAMVNVALVTVWLLLAFWTGRENAKVSAVTAA